MQYGTIDREFAAKLATYPPELDGPALMVNLMKYRATADYGYESQERVTGREADDRYAPVDVLRDIGARIVFVGDVESEAGGPDPAWDRVAIVKYATRRSFIEMQARRDFKERKVHKDAGMEFTINLTAVPDAPVVGEPDGSGLVRFVLWPEGTAPEGPVGEGSVLPVEGRVIGDERRWGLLGLHYATGYPTVPGAVVVAARPSLDLLPVTLATWP